MNRLAALPIMLCMLMLMQGCYSFHGGSVPAHITTVAVPLFEDRTGAGVSQLTIDFTEQLIRHIEARSRLQVGPNRDRADAVVEAEMTSFTDESSQLSSETERALTNRITIVVHARFLDNTTRKPLFPRTSFTGFADYASGDFPGQQKAIDAAVDQITEDLFNRMISIW
ncbi:LptE family protein [Prosthecochloris sp. N3]|uniref:LptE family protein n=1 Tax=Prosthecochloris ethylica TaxID=2743976 RepID=A0ABR9XVD2_9CHLB|nr:LPS assembly lipoprotein LptE [Prosthecochloris ethylica]MBF0587429.1 LptE family protein [Prosthecochloris ethylica]MBF0637616.1 LptE family protein [Prosthecochloris ethylica]MEC9487294.1 LPS assembly lipoprotein LptE [Prosthecochloris sp.]NUK48509.1 LptE family protein [Prosthecochloris ethylica]